ncbi:LysR family transcriptional regulator [Rouxiella sp. WC2420]|uniref:LysR family transcriptional regulator n=1 Tax=Rouxiella sp. WC2420 TaxID=3234145 RepID=A0AB39VSU4_9GAMM
MKLSLEALLILDALERHGSFAAAAATLFKTPSALSYTIQKMESDLNIKLLDRSGHRATFTSTGKLMLDKGRVLLQAVSELEQEAQYVESGWESNLTLALDASVPLSILNPLIELFYEQHQHTQLHFTHEVLAGTWEALLYHRADIIIGAVREPVTRGGIGCTPLGWLEYAFAISPRHPLAEVPEPLEREKIRQYRAVVIQDSSKHSTGADLRILDRQKLLTVADFNGKLNAQLAGLGCGYLPRYMAEPYLQSGKLVEKVLDAECYQDMAYLAWNENASGNAAKWWIEHLKNFAGFAKIYSTR